MQLFGHRSIFLSFLLCHYSTAVILAQNGSEAMENSHLGARSALLVRRQNIILCGGKSMFPLTAFSSTAKMPICPQTLTTPPIAPIQSAVVPLTACPPMLLAVRTVDIALLALLVFCPTA